MSKRREGVNWTSVAQCVVKLWNLKGNIMKLRVSLMAGEFLANSGVVN